jgi:hypothetical protein
MEKENMELRRLIEISSKETREEFIGKVGEALQCVI